MTTKEAIHRLVDALDEKDAVAVLAYVQAVAGDDAQAPVEETDSDAVPRSLERRNVDQPALNDDSLWRIVGMIGDAYDRPLDAAPDHDRYPAEAYADVHDDDERAADEAPAFTLDDPLWSLVGIGRTAEPTHVAKEKDDYLADAFDIHRR